MTCFLCQHKLSSIANKTNDDEKEEILNFKKLSLVAIKNYLRLSENLISTNFGNDNSKGWQVLICEKCEIITSRLSLLCTQLEELKLKIGYHLEEFYGKLEETTDTDGRSNDLIVLRNAFSKSCQTKLSKLLQPVINIDKLKIVKVKMKKEMILSDDETGSEHENLEMIDDSDSEFKQQQLQENPVKFENTSMEEDEDNEWEGETSSSVSLTSHPSSSSSHLNHPITKKRRYYREDAEGNYICTTCGLPFPSKWERRQHTQVHRNARKLQDAKFICTKCDNHQMFREAGGLRRHNMLFHLELIFPDSRIEGITPSQFGDYCKHVLHVEGLISKLPNTLGYACQHCKEKPPFNTYLSLRKHLFRKHLGILGGKIEELQRTTGVEELKQAALPPVSDNRKCEDCGATFSQFGSLCRHLRLSCPFRRNKTVSAKRPCECRECGARYNGTAAFYNHRKNKHPNSIKDPLYI